MSATLKRAQRGAPLVIPAETFNAFVDVALDHQRRQRGVGRTGQREQPQTGIILIRNESGAARARFDVLGIAGPIIKPSDNADAFKERVALRGVTPAAEHAGRFVVLTEPLATGAIGRAYADGICPVRVEMVDENLGFAEVEAGTVDTLQSASGGSAGLLWVQPVEERDHPAIAWTVARIGGGGSPSGGMSAFCKITGSVGASAPFAYSGTEQEFSGVGTWQEKSGGLSFDATLRNVAEYVHSGAAEVPDGALVVIHQATDGDVWVFDRLHYRGVYG